MELNESLRAVDYMRGALRDQRCDARTSFHLPGTVKQTRAATMAHVAFTRDVSTNGLFFYSDFTPALGDDLTLTFNTPHGGCLMFQGNVVRVEQQKPGSAIGIALLLYTRLLAA